MTNTTVRTRILEAAADCSPTPPTPISRPRRLRGGRRDRADALPPLRRQGGVAGRRRRLRLGRLPRSKRTFAAVVHEHVADDIRAGWDNHIEFARENPNFYKLMWSPGIAANSAAFRDAYQMLYERMELGASRGQLRVSAERAAK